MLDLIRGLVRPIITVIGFLALVILVLKMGWSFADRELAILIIGEFLGFMAAMIAWWFKERSEKPH